MASVLQTEILWRSSAGRAVRVVVREFWPTDRPINWYRLLTNWLIVSTIDLVADWLTDWLTDCLNNRLTVWLTVYLSVCLQSISVLKEGEISRLIVLFDFCFFDSNYLTSELWTFWMSVFLECIASPLFTVSVWVLTSSSVVHVRRSFDHSQSTVNLDWSCPISYEKKTKIYYSYRLAD